MTDIEPKSHRRRLQFGLATLLVVVTLAAILAASLPRSNAFPHTLPDPAKQVESVEVSLARPIDASLPISIADAEEAKVVAPLGRARLDPRRADYVYAGMLVVHYTDGSQDGATLFLPWGHFNYRGAYGIADFSSLREACRMGLSQSTDPYAAQLLNDPHFWR